MWRSSKSKPVGASKKHGEGLLVTQWLSSHLARGLIVRLILMSSTRAVVLRSGIDESTSAAASEATS